MSMEFNAQIDLHRQSSIGISEKPLLTGPDGLLAAIELLVENDAFDPQDITQITIWICDEEDKL